MGKACGVLAIKTCGEGEEPPVQHEWRLRSAAGDASKATRLGGARGGGGMRKSPNGGNDSPALSLSGVWRKPLMPLDASTPPPQHASSVFGLGWNLPRFRC